MSEKIAVIFDLDGTLLDTESKQADFYREALEDLFARDKAALKSLQIFLPKGTDGVENYMITLMGKKSEEQRIIMEKRLDRDISDKDMLIINNYVEYSVLDNITPASVVKGAKQMLKEFAEDPNVELFIITSTERNTALTSLQKAELMPFFKLENIYSGELFDSKSEIFKHLNKDRGIAFADMLWIGDSLSDINAAKEDHITTIASTGFVPADMVETRKQDLLDLGASDVVTPSLLSLKVKKFVEGTKKTIELNRSMNMALYDVVKTLSL